MIVSMLVYVHSYSREISFILTTHVGTKIKTSSGYHCSSYELAIEHRTNLTYTESTFNDLQITEVAVIS